MENVSKVRKNVCTQFGLWSVIICMVAGLATKMRPLVILGLSAIAFTISAMLGYILISFIQAHSRFQKKPASEETAESGSVANSSESQNEEEAIENTEI